MIQIENAVPGVSVRILEPFAQYFPGVYGIVSMDGTTAHLSGLPENTEDAFDIIFLEVAS